VSWPVEMNEGRNRGRLLILASKLGYQTRGFAEAAENLGVEVSFGTDRCHQLEDPWADGALTLHFEDPESAAAEIAAQVESHRPQAIVVLGDRPTTTAAYAAALLGLEGNAPESVEICRNKLRQRETLHAAGVPVPKFFSFALDSDLNEAASRAWFPCVIKPLALAASQGVMRANDADEFRRAAARLGSLMENPEILATREPTLGLALAESYVPGKEVAIEGLLTDGRLRILAIFDKPDPLEGPYFEETIYVTPSRLVPGQQDAIRACAEKAVGALGLKNGPVHAEFRINEDGPWVLEVAPRPIGGLCSRALRFGPERISLEELLIRHALGLGGSGFEREREASGVMMIPVPRSGILERVGGIEAAEKTAGVTEIRITARLRDYIAAWPEGSSYLGFIFARAELPEQAEAALRAAHAKLQFTFSPRLPVEHPVTQQMQR
jgi:biotin carboxylase